MAEVTVEIELLTELQGDYGLVPSVRVACPECGAEGEAYGQHENSVKRAIMEMKDDCDCRGAFFVFDPDDLP